MADLTSDLHARGVRRLMVEGGGAVHTQFLADDLVDELQLVVAPFFVGESGARRFVGEGRFPWHPGRRARLAETRQLGDVVLLRYALSERFAAARRPHVSSAAPDGCRFRVLQHEGQAEDDRDELGARCAEDVEPLPLLVRPEQPDRAGERERAQGGQPEARGERCRPASAASGPAGSR